MKADAPKYNNFLTIRFRPSATAMCSAVSPFWNQ
jgi:hypothetical protein